MEEVRWWWWWFHFFVCSPLFGEKTDGVVQPPIIYTHTDILSKESLQEIVSSDS